jgi:hypothetical protein
MKIVKNKKKVFPKIHNDGKQWRRFKDANYEKSENFNNFWKIKNVNDFQGFLKYKQNLIPNT